MKKLINYNGKMMILTAKIKEAKEAFKNGCMVKEEVYNEFVNEVYDFSERIVDAEIFTK